MTKNTIASLIRRFSSRNNAILAFLFCFCLNAAAYAQNNPLTPTAPTPGSAPKSRTWVWYMLSLLLFAAVMAVSLKPGKRTHQD